MQKRITIDTPYMVGDKSFNRNGSSLPVIKLKSKVPVFKLELLSCKRLNLVDDFNAWSEEEREREAKIAANRRAFREDLNSLIGYNYYDYYDGYYDGYYDDYYNDYYDPYYGRPYNSGSVNKKKKKTGTIKSTKYINGIQVDDKEFAEYNKKTRRAGFKNKKKSDSDQFDFYEYNKQIEDVDVIDDTDPNNKKIIFYRHLNNTADVYEFNNVYDFDEWITDNNLIIREEEAFQTAYRYETHCALDYELSSKDLICADSYEDLVFRLTLGDEKLLKELSAKDCNI